MRICHTLGRGVVAAHGALIGALFLFLLHAPLQILSAMAQGFPPGAARDPGQQPAPAQVALMMGVSCGTFVLSLAVFFLFPLVLGGILGQVRDRLESPHQAPGAFGSYGRTFYSRLLGMQALFMLVTFVLLLPVMAYAIWLAMEVAALGSAAPDTPMMTGQLLSSPAFIAAMVAFSVAASVVGLVYWMANCVVVAEGERVMASLRLSLHFCRQNVVALLVLWLVNLAAGLVMSPFALACSRIIGPPPWVLVPLAVVYAALIAYWGLILAGLVMSLYLAGRPPAERVEAKEPVLAGRA
jgi:hypothetical protein